MDRVVVRANAKINLGLEVLARRVDGYHDIDTVFQTVTLADVLEIEPSPDAAVVLRVSGEEVPAGEANLAWRAAAATAAATGCPGVSIRLTKLIPVGAGMGGGSADAAGVIAGMNELFGLGLDAAAMRTIGLAVGSDVPFLIEGGTARGRGRGEVLEPLPALGGVWFLLATPPFEVSARDAYRAVRFGLTKRTGFTKLICSSIRDRDVPALCSALANDLEPGVARLHPEVARLAERLRACGARGVVMSGSGPTVVAVAGSKTEADGLAAALEGFGGRVHVAGPAEAGCVITRP